MATKLVTSLVLFAIALALTLLGASAEPPVGGTTDRSAPPQVEPASEELLAHTSGQTGRGGCAAGFSAGTGIVVDTPGGGKAVLVFGRTGINISPPCR